jgi:hypothetical protein
MFCSCFKPVEEVAEIKKEEQPNLYDNKQDIEAFNQQENFEGQNFKEGFKKSYPEDSHKDVEDQYEDPNQDNHDQQQPEEYEQNQEEQQNISFTEEERAARPEDEFSQYIFENINKLRFNPSSFVSNIEESMNNIITDSHGRLVYVSPKGKLRVALNQGKPAFEEAINVLNNTQPMDQLCFLKEMSVELPDNEEEIKSKNYLKEKVNELVSDGVYIKSFWKDIVRDPETCFLLMVVDDSGLKSGSKRRDILDPDMKYMGISSIRIGKSFASYMTFSHRK